jgi:hypothetical protein
MMLPHDFPKALERKLTEDAIKWYLQYDDFILAMEESTKTIARIEADSVSEEDMGCFLEGEDDADDAERRASFGVKGSHSRLTNSADDERSVSTPAAERCSKHRGSAEDSRWPCVLGLPIASTFPGSE